MAAPSPPRDCDPEVPLYVPFQTLRCVCSRCRVCAHAVAGSRWSLPVPNARPEECHTITGRVDRSPGSVCFPLRAGQSVLTLGDGNLSFSRSVAEHLPGARITATCFEDREKLVAAYGDELVSNEAAIRAREGCSVVHGVDATALGDAPLAKDAVFDRIVWNFPCIASSSPAGDGQNAEMEANKELLRAFFACAGARLADGGEVHVAHKTKPPYSHWGIVRIAESQGLACRGSVVLSRAAFPAYRPRKVFDGSGFPTADARVFVFGRGGAGPAHGSLPEPGELEPVAAARPASGGEEEGSNAGAGDDRVVRATGRAHVRRTSRKRARHFQVHDHARALETAAKAEATALALDRVPFWRPGDGAEEGAAVAVVCPELVARIASAFGVHAAVAELVSERKGLQGRTGLRRARCDPESLLDAGAPAGSSAEGRGKRRRGAGAPAGNAFAALMDDSDGSDSE